MKKLIILLSILMCVYAYAADIEDKPYSTAMLLSDTVLRDDGESIFYISGSSGLDTSTVYYQYPNTVLTVVTTSPGDDSVVVVIYIWEGDASDLTDMNMLVADTVTVSAVGTIIQELNLSGARNYFFIADGGTDNGDSTAIEIRQDRNRY